MGKPTPEQSKLMKKSMEGFHLRDFICIEISLSLKIETLVSLRLSSLLEEVGRAADELLNVLRFTRNHSTDVCQFLDTKADKKTNH